LFDRQEFVEQLAYGNRPLGLIQVCQVMTDSIKQARVVSLKQPVALGGFKFLPVREPQRLAMIIAKLPCQSLDISLGDRFLREELLLRAFGALQTRRHTNHPGSL
jgi:hypothetical protein